MGLYVASSLGLDCKPMRRCTMHSRNYISTCASPPCRPHSSITTQMHTEDLAVNSLPHLLRGRAKTPSAMFWLFLTVGQLRHNHGGSHSLPPQPQSKLSSSHAFAQNLAVRPSRGRPTESAGRGRRRERSRRGEGDPEPISPHLISSNQSRKKRADSNGLLHWIHRPHVLPSVRPSVRVSSCSARSDLAGALAAWPGLGAWLCAGLRRPHGHLRLPRRVGVVNSTWPEATF